MGQQISCTCAQSPSEQAVEAAESAPPIYLDHGATTPVDPRVAQAMMPFLGEKFGNPSAVTYSYGSEAKAALEQARASVAELFGADKASELIFTSGASEANAIAIMGSVTARAASAEEKPHIITSLLEHGCVLESCKRLERTGVATVTYLGVSDRSGVTRVKDVMAVVRPNTALVSIMFANNEIGVINEIPLIAKALAERNGGKILFHVDGAQSVGKVPFKVSEHAVHFMSTSAHKFYGPKGVGALYIRQSVQHQVDALVKGGGQEFGIRGGTQNVPGIVGMGEAAKLAVQALRSEGVRLAALRDHVLQRLEKELPPKCPPRVTGSTEERLPANLHFAVPGCDAERLLGRIRRRVAFSSGSACSAASGKQSQVMRALGVPADWPFLRLGFGRFTTQEETDEAVDVIVAAVKDIFDPVEATRAGELGPLAPSVGVGAEAAPPKSSAPKARQASALDEWEMAAKQGGGAPSALEVIGFVKNTHDKPVYIEWRSERSVIRVDDRWRVGLQGLDKWTHLHVMWHMDQEKSTKTAHVPQALYDKVPQVGIFACRCPQRPNKIALSICKLISVDAGTGALEVEGLDAINGSVVLDIKPYIPVLDELAHARRGSVAGEPEWNKELQY